MFIRFLCVIVFSVTCCSTPLCGMEESGQLAQKFSLAEYAGLGWHDEVQKKLPGATQETLDAALVEASFRGHTKVAELLLTQGADPKAKNQKGVRAFTFAVLLQHFDVATLLKKAGADSLKIDKSLLGNQYEANFVFRSLEEYDVWWYNEQPGAQCFLAIMDRRLFKHYADKLCKWRRLTYHAKKGHIQRLKEEHEIWQKHQPPYCLLNDEGTYPDHVMKEWERQVKAEKATMFGNELMHRAK